MIKAPANGLQDALGSSPQLLITGHWTGGVILADQVKSLDWQARNAELMDQIPMEIMNEVLGKLGTLLSG